MRGNVRLLLKFNFVSGLNFGSLPTLSFADTGGQRAGRTAVVVFITKSNLNNAHLFWESFFVVLSSNMVLGEKKNSPEVFLR